MTHSQLQFRLFVGKVLTNVPDDHSLFRDEVFGPVTAITKFSTESEVIKRAIHDTNYDHIIQIDLIIQIDILQKYLFINGLN